VRVTLGGPGCALTLGPGGEAVTDSFYFVHQPMAAGGSITVRVTSMTGSYSPGGAPGQEQLDIGYTPANGYFPLSPWAGFAVLCLWAALALGLAGYLLRRRDA